MPTLAEALDPNAPVYGFYPHLNPKVANKPDTLNTPEAKGKLAETLLSMAPGSGEALSLRDAWNASGKGAEALQGGNYGQAASEYGNLATALLASLPGAGVIARGTKRGAEWMNQNLPAGVNKLVDAMMPSDPKNTLNIFAGPTAKTADTAALAKAEEMAATGASRDDIWNQTGWFQGNDGKWRFEIDDSTAGLKNDEQFIAEFGPLKGQAVNRFEGLDHPGLKEAYPWLADEFSFAGNYAPGRQTLGLFSPGTNRMEVTAGSPEAALSTALHEHQHAIQNKEGFARGGSRAAVTPDAIAAERDRIQANAPAPGWTSVDVLPETGMDEDAIRHELYRRISGEVEARNVQARMNMTPEERRASPPWMTQDVPDEQQIVNSGPLARAMMMSQPKDNPSWLVDDAGNPITVYHGGPGSNPYAKDGSGIEQFRTNQDGLIYFTDNPALASDYATARYPDRGAVYPTHLNMVNPLIVDRAEDLTQQKWLIARAKEEGRDGIILKNADDSVTGQPQRGPSTVYIAFDPEQTRFAFGQKK